MRYLIATGFMGKLEPELGVNTVEAYTARNEAILRGEVKGFRLFTPILEQPIPAEPEELWVANYQTLTSKVSEKYRQMCDDGSFVPGMFGDFIQVYQIGFNNFAMQVSRKAFHKPALAADLAVVIRGENGEGHTKYILVTGTRKADPGKGKPAWLGGFTNISTAEDGTEVLDSFAYTLLHEGVEEAGLRIEHSTPEALQRDYNADNVDVTAHLGDEQYAGVMMNLGMIQTSDLPFAEGGERYPDGSKRVHITNGYACMINTGSRQVAEDNLEELLKAGDDIGILQFHDITHAVKSGDPQGLHEILQFGIEHHNHFISPVVKTSHEYFECEE